MTNTGCRACVQCLLRSPDSTHQKHSNIEDLERLFNYQVWDRGATTWPDNVHLGKPHGAPSPPPRGQRPLAVTRRAD